MTHEKLGHGEDFEGGAKIREDQFDLEDKVFRSKWVQSFSCSNPSSTTSLSLLVDAIIHGCFDNHTVDERRGTLRSAMWLVNFDKSCVFCGKFCVCMDKCVFIVIKIKYTNFSKIYNICNKINFTINYTYFTTPYIYLSKHTKYFIRTRRYYKFWHFDRST